MILLMCSIYSSVYVKSWIYKKLKSQKLRRLLEDIYSIHTHILNILTTEYDFVSNSNHPCSLSWAEPICTELALPQLRVSYAMKLVDSIQVLERWSVLEKFWKFYPMLVRLTLSDLANNIILLFSLSALGTQ